GDSSNAMVYLRRCAPALEVSFLSALGDDPYSKQILAFWKESGIRTNHVKILPGELPGLSIIQNETNGERQFYYWRGQSAYRKLVPAIGDELNFKEFNFLYLSGITVAATPNEHRTTLLNWVEQAKRMGITIVFDPNYRVRLWKDSHEARVVLEPFIDLTDLFLASDDDLKSLLPDQADTSFVLGLMASGCSEAVIRRGPKPCDIFYNGRHLQVDAVNATPIDTTGAGDSFNGTYLACRIQGVTPENAARQAHTIAAQVVAHKGAIIPA
ncbi:MAG: sugar kinase, partial [Gammaproteobacteria bacterium]|nr:sugar kinase [Gammaproteobacteria bacterium]